MLNLTQTEFFLNFTPFMQLSATLYLGSIAIYKYDSFKTLFLKDESKKFTDFDIDFARIVSSDDFYDIMKHVKNKQEEKLCNDYKKKANLFKLEREKKESDFRYFSHYSMYMFLFCFGFLVIIPTLPFIPYISEISIYRMSLFFSLLTIIYLIFLSHIFNKIEQVNPYVSVLLPFGLLIVISFSLCHIKYENCFLFQPIHGLISTYHSIIVILTMIITVMLGLSILVFHIMLIALTQNRINKMGEYLTANNEKVKSVIEKYKHITCVKPPDNNDLKKPDALQMEYPHN